MIRTFPVALGSFYQRLLDLCRAHGGALSSIDFLRGHLILVDGEVKYDDSTSIAAFRNAETARWTRESFQRLKGAIVSAFVIIARPARRTTNSKHNSSHQSNRRHLHNNYRNSGLLSSFGRCTAPASGLRLCRWCSRTSS